MFHEVAQKLRKAGCRVRVHHLRYYRSVTNPVVVETYEAISGRSAAQEGFLQSNAMPHGGVTIVTVTTPDGKSYDETAFCSQKDAYNKKLGREIALGRLFKRFPQLNTHSEGVLSEGKI